MVEPQVSLTQHYGAGTTTSSLNLKGGNFMVNQSIGQSKGCSPIDSLPNILPNAGKDADITQSFKDYDYNESPDDVVIKSRTESPTQGGGFTAIK